MNKKIKIKYSLLQKNPYFLYNSYTVPKLLGNLESKQKRKVMIVRK